jgi:hypothetical protein
LALRLLKMEALVIGNAAVQDMMMAALDNADRIHLYISQMLYGLRRRLGPLAKRSRHIQTLSLNPQGFRLRLRDFFHDSP